MGWQDGWHNRHPVSRLRERQQCVWCAAFDENLRLVPREPAGGIERRADPETGVWKQKRIGSKVAYFDVSTRPEPKRFVAHGKKVERRQWTALELMTFGLNNLQVADNEVQPSAFQFCIRFGANRLTQFDLHIGKVCSIAMQER